MTKIEALEKLARRHIQAAETLTLDGKSLFAIAHEKEAARITTLIASLPDAKQDQPQATEDQ